MKAVDIFQLVVKLFGVMVGIMGVMKLFNGLIMMFEEISASPGLIVNGIFALILARFLLRPEWLVKYCYTDKQNSGGE